ncbi:MAG: ATP phosphoribosyltransferase [Bdellovibrionota bacterium]
MRPVIKVALTSGRIQSAVAELLEKAGLKLDFGSNGRILLPRVIGDDRFEFAVVRSKDAARLLKEGAFDAAFLGQDMLAEVRALDAVQVLLDTERDRVNLVLAVRECDSFRVLRGLEGEPMSSLPIATKYTNLVADWLAERPTPFPATIVPVEGSVEVFAHILEGGIVDVVSSGETLRTNGLVPVNTLRASSTVLAANRGRMSSDPERSKSLEDLVFALSGVIEGSKRQELSVNVTRETEPAVVRILEAYAMRSVNRIPTANGDSATLRIAVPIRDKFTVLRQVREAGATDPMIVDVQFLA